MIDKLRSIIFNIVFYGWTTVIILCFPFIALLPTSKYMCKTLRLWSFGSVFISRWAMGIKTIIIGRENIPAHTVGILAAKHASNFDAVLAWQLRSRVTAFAKKELFNIPFLGMMFNKIGVIKVDRGSGKNFSDMERVASFMEETKNLMIVFPEATRVKPGVKKKLKSGAYHLYKEYDIPVYPVATNTGQLWRKGFWHKSGTVVYEIGKALPPGLEKKEFMAEMHNNIILRSDEIMRENGLELLPYEEQVLYHKKGR